jgi:ABC-type phosphate transport system substrate-binding protein
MAGRRRSAEFLAALCLLVCAPQAAAVDIAVIVARDAPEQRLDAGMLRDIYLKKIFLDASGRRFIPVNLPAAAPLREAFTQALFRKSGDELQDYWNQNYFHGITPPYVLGSEDAVLRFVAQTPGAIGYVADCHVNADVRQVHMLSIEPKAGVKAEDVCPQGMETSSPHP